MKLIVTNNHITIPQDIMDKMMDMQLIKVKLDIMEKELKEALMNAFQETGLPSFENDYLTAVPVKASVRKVVDTKALKDDGLYEAYTKETKVSPTVKISWK